MKIIKKSDINQIKKIGELEYDIFFPNNYSINEINKMLQTNDFHIMVELDNNKLIGYCLFLDNIKFNEVEIFKIGVDKYYRKMGIGTKIIDQLKNKYSKIILEVSDRDDTKKFYEKNLFNLVGKRNGYYFDGSNALLYEWKK